MWIPQEVGYTRSSWVVLQKLRRCSANHDFSHRSRNTKVHHHVHNSYNSESDVLLISPSTHVRMHLCKPAACTRATALERYCLINSSHCAKLLFVHTELPSAKCRFGHVTCTAARLRWGSTQLVPLNELNVSFRPYILFQDFFLGISEIVP
jgi:hypothetical protein